MAASGPEGRYISNNHFGDNTNIYQGDFHLHVLYNQARAEVKAVCAIPYPRNEDLVPRPDLINKLEELLPQKPGFYSAALWGLGGSGKTQLAIYYAYQRCNDSECCVFWVHADSEATFITDYKKIGKKLGVSDTLDGSDLLDAVRNRIEEQSRWVIIFDNADDLKLFGVMETNRTNDSLYKYIPQGGSHGTVLWTSRNKRIQGTLVGSARGIEVPAMTREEATSLLVAASGDTSAVEDTDVDRLLEELERLPLAVSQAGAYMRQTSMTMKKYLELLMQGSKRWDLLNMNGFDRHRRPEVSNSVLETWKISTTRIRGESELSYRILHVIAYLDSQDIPFELIMSATRYDVGDKGKAKEISENEVELAVARLVEFSFLDIRREEGGSQSYEMHKLVQEAVRYGLRVQGQMDTALDRTTTTGNSAENGEAEFSSMALQIVDDMFPVPEKTSWAKCDKYMAHAIRVGEWAEMSGKKIETASLLTKGSDFLNDRGRWREKEPIDQRVVNLRRDALGEKHPETMSGMVCLVITYYEQGRYDEAEEICTKVLNLQQEVLGEKHQHTIYSMSLLAGVYTSQGRYDEAEELYKQALSFQHELLGERHPDTIWTMSYLASVYKWQGHYSKGEGIIKQVLDIRQKEFGENHLYTIRSMEELAETYWLQSQYDKAEDLQKRVLDFKRLEFGDKHPQTIRAMSGLAIIYHGQHLYTEAEQIQKQVLDLHQEVLGEKHPYTIKNLADLAITCSTQGQLDKAEGMQTQALDLHREVLGEKHPRTAKLMTNLGNTYQWQGRYEEAERMYEQAVTLQEEVLGKNDPYVLRTMTWLAMTFGQQRQFDKAEEIQSKALDRQREILGEKHPDTIESMKNLGTTYYWQSRYAEAERVYKQVLIAQQELLGENHPEVFRTLTWFAGTFANQGQFHNAKEIQRQALERQRELLGEKHPDTIRSIAHLESIKRALGRDDKQKPGRRTLREFLRFRSR